MSAFELTSLGKQSALNTQGRGAEFAIVSKLYETDSPLEFEEIAESLNLSDEKCSMLLHKLINTEKVREL